MSVHSERAEERSKASTRWAVSSRAMKNSLVQLQAVRCCLTELTLVATQTLGQTSKQARRRQLRLHLGGTVGVRLWENSESDTPREMRLG